MGLLKCTESEDYETAARYLQPTPGQDTNLVQRARELYALHGRFKGNIGLLSDDPNGSVEPGLPPGEVRAGVLAVGRTTTQTLLRRFQTCGVVVKRTPLGRVVSATCPTSHQSAILNQLGFPSVSQTLRIVLLEVPTG